jgi:pentatricopeptide repeat protein
MVQPRRPVVRLHTVVNTNIDAIMSQIGRTQYRRQNERTCLSAQAHYYSSTAFMCSYSDEIDLLDIDADSRLQPHHSLSPSVDDVSDDKIKEAATAFLPLKSFPQNPMESALTERLYDETRRLLYSLTVTQLHEPTRPEHWVEAEQCLWALSNIRTVKSVDLSWRLLEALIQNLQDDGSSNLLNGSHNDDDTNLNGVAIDFDLSHAKFLSNWDLWHSVLLNWQEVSKNFLEESNSLVISSDIVIAPSDLLSKLDHWASVLSDATLVSRQRHQEPNSEQNSFVVINSKTLSLFLDIVGSQGKYLANQPNSVTGEIVPYAEFAEKLLIRMMDHSIANTIRSDISFHPSTSNLNMVLMLWARSAMIDRAWRLLQDAIASEILRPDLRSYNAVLQAYAKVGDGKSAERVLYELLRQQQREQEQHEAEISVNSETKPTNILQPSILSWNTVLAAWARSHDKVKGAQRVEHLLSMMVTYSNGGRIIKDSDHSIKAEIVMENIGNASGLPNWRQSVKPNLITLNTSLSAWARVGDAETCARLLGEMRDLYKAGQLDDPPDSFSYATVMNAFAKSGQPQKAEALWDGMYEAYSQNGAKELKPTLTIVTTVIDAYCRQISEAVNKKNYETAFNGLVKAEKIFQSIRELYLLGHLDSGPDTAAYNVILKCYLYCGRANALPSSSDTTAACADEMLLEMKKLQASKQNDVCPTFATYSIVIQAWLTRSDGVPRAIELLDEVWQKRATGDPRMKPDSVSVSSIITSLCQANQPKVAHKFLLSICEVRRREPLNMVEPKIESFGTVFAALNRSKDSDAAHVAHSLAEQMKELHKLKVLSQGPDSLIYQTLISVWANSGLSGSSKKAYDIYTEMKRRASEGDESMKPDLKTCHQILFVLSGRNPEPVVAENVVRQMYDEFKSNTSTVKPDSKTFNYALMAWARSNHPESLNRVDTLFKEMQRLHKEEEITCDVVTFNIVLHCLASTSKREGAERAEALLARMNELAESGHETFRPTAVSYGCIINAWVRVLDLPRAEAVLVSMYREFQAGKTLLKPLHRHFEQVSKAWLSTNDKAKHTRSQAVLTLMRLVYPHTKDKDESNDKRVVS